MNELSNSCRATAPAIRCPDAHTRKLVFAGLGALAILIVAGDVCCAIHPPASQRRRLPSLSNVAKATAIDLYPVSITALGAAQAWTSVTVLAQVSGKLLSVDFKEGTDVKKGQLLAEIDPRLVGNIDQGTLARDRALLADARPST